MKGVIIIEWLDGRKEKIYKEDYFDALDEQAKLLKKYKNKMNSCAVKAIFD